LHGLHGPVRVSAVFDAMDDDLLCVVVDAEQHTVGASAGGTDPRDGLGQLVGDRPRSRWLRTISYGPRSSPPKATDCVDAADDITAGVGGVSFPNVGKG
jgi:hypothetical protein